MCDRGIYRLKTSPEHKDYVKTCDLPYDAINDGLVTYTTSHGIPQIAVAKGKIYPSSLILLHVSKYQL